MLRSRKVSFVVELLNLSGQRKMKCWTKWKREKNTVVRVKSREVYVCHTEGMRWKSRRLNCCGLWRAGGAERRQERRWAGREEVWSTGEEFKVPLFWKSGGRESWRVKPPTDAGQHGRELSHGEGRTETFTERFTSVLLEFFLIDTDYQQ